MKRLNKLLYYSPRIRELPKVLRPVAFVEGAISLPEATRLYELATQTKTGCIVEIGSYRGRSTAALGLGSLDGAKVPVYAVDPHEPFTGVLGAEFGPEDRGAFMKNMLDTKCYEVVRLVNLSSTEAASGWTHPIGLLWIDGDHSYEGVKVDFDAWSPYLLPQAPVVFDDSLNPDIGPYRLIAELIESGRFEKTDAVGKITILRQA